MVINNLVGKKADIKKLTNSLKSQGLSDMAIKELIKTNITELITKLKLAISATKIEYTIFRSAFFNVSQIIQISKRLHLLRR